MHIFKILQEMTMDEWEILLMTNITHSHLPFMNNDRMRFSKTISMEKYKHYFSSNAFNEVKNLTNFDVLCCSFRCVRIHVFAMFLVTLNCAVLSCPT